MNVGILGTGNLAIALARAWSAAGHRICITGRDTAKAGLLAREIGGSIEAVEPSDLAARVDVVVVAIAWEGPIRGVWPSWRRDWLPERPAGDRLHQRRRLRHRST